MRRFKLQDVGLEITTVSKADHKGYRARRSLYLTFISQDERDIVYQALIAAAPPTCQTQDSISALTFQWLSNNLSNLDYLLGLNSYAYRSFQDITQYPVFPWILQDYKSETLDLEDPK